jgi:hypothetical protein
MPPVLPILVVIAGTRDRGRRKETQRATPDDSGFLSTGLPDATRQAPTNAVIALLGRHAATFLSSLSQGGPRVTASTRVDVAITRSTIRC